MAHCVVLATGGTIAGLSPGAGVGYQAAQLGVDDLVRGLPLPAGLGLELEQVAQVDSKDMDESVWLRLAQRCEAHLARPEVNGLVITHGTDTLEETAFFLDQVLPALKPVVLTCAMRPANAVGADGPRNLLDAFTVACDGQARGVLAVCAGRVHGARRVQKVHPTRLDAFDSGDAGPLGFVEGGRVVWTGLNVDAARPSGAWPASSLQARQAWPRVEIVHSHTGASAALVEALLAQGVDGLVVACTGNGTVHARLEAALRSAQAAGVAVLRASRCPAGRIVEDPGAELPSAGDLSPVKARIALALDLMRRPAAQGPEAALTR